MKAFGKRNMTLRLLEKKDKEEGTMLSFIYLIFMYFNAKLGLAA